MSIRFRGGIMQNNKFIRNEQELFEKSGSAKAIIFDVDGVLMNSVDESGRFLWSKTAKQDLGLETTHFKQIFSDEWTKATRGQIDTKDHLDRVFKELNIDITSNTFIDYWLSRDNHVDQDVLKFVDSLMHHNISLYIGTNQDKYRTTHIRKVFPIHFKGIFSSSDIGFIKPEPGFYNHIEEALGLRPSDILLIDDTFENIEGAQSQGWKTHHYV